MELKMFAKNLIKSYMSRNDIRQNFRSSSEAPLTTQKMVNGLVTPKTFLKTYLNTELKGVSFKAFHLLTGKIELPYKRILTVIVKSLYFEKKSGVHSTKAAQREAKHSQG